MYLRQQNILLINKIWITEKFQQEASSGSLSFYPVLGNKKSDYREKGQLNSAFWFAVVHVHYGLKEHPTQFLFYYHYVVCYMPFSLRLTWWKVKNMHCNWDCVNIDNGKAEFGGGLQWPSDNDIIWTCSADKDFKPTWWFYSL